MRKDTQKILIFITYFKEPHLQNACKNSKNFSLGFYILIRKHNS